MPRIVYSREAEEELYRLPRSVYDRFQRAFDALEVDPVSPGTDYRVKRLREAGGRRVVRFGRWGAIYRIEGENVRILKVGPRSTLYRGT
ncbi:MAG TPA: type II toxin-antitoxin system RelE/ParE family toxin [Thermoplasmata archaeon]|nr:type II toxin-antitoxin system RelE/ParE family toxin [Thermoplasmata archaeon]